MAGGDAAARRAAAWRFLRAVLRSQADGVVGAALSGLAWQVGAVAAPLIVARAIDHGILTRDRRTLLLWTLALLGGLLPLPLISAAGWAYSKRYHERQTRLQEELARAATLAEETISGIRVVKGLGAGEALGARFRQQSDRIVQRGLDVARVDAVFVPSLELLPLLGLLVVLWFGG